VLSLRAKLIECKNMSYYVIVLVNLKFCEAIITTLSSCIKKVIIVKVFYAIKPLLKK